MLNNAHLILAADHDTTANHLSNSLAASASSDGSVRLWDPVNRTPVGVRCPRSRSARVAALRATGDRNALLVVAGDPETLYPRKYGILA